MTWYHVTCCEVMCDLVWGHVICYEIMWPTSSSVSTSLARLIAFCSLSRTQGSTILYWSTKSCRLNSLKRYVKYIYIKRKSNYLTKAQTYLGRISQATLRKCMSLSEIASHKEENFLSSINLITGPFTQLIFDYLNYIMHLDFLQNLSVCFF